MRAGPGVAAALARRASRSCCRRPCWPGCRCRAARRTSCWCWSSPIGLAGGPSAGLATGFAAGLLTDLLSDHPIGVLALCFALAGFLAGLLEADVGRSVLLPVVVVAVASAAVYLAYLGVLGLLGRSSADGAAGVLGTVRVRRGAHAVRRPAGAWRSPGGSPRRALTAPVTTALRLGRDPDRGGLAAAHPRRPALLPAGPRPGQAGPDRQPAAHPRGHPGRPRAARWSTTAAGRWSPTAARWSCRSNRAELQAEPDDGAAVLRRLAS